MPGGAAAAPPPPPHFWATQTFGAAGEIWEKPVPKEVSMLFLEEIENICQSETPYKESFSRVAKFYKIDGEILEAKQKTYPSFRHVHRLGNMTVSEMLETMHETETS